MAAKFATAGYVLIEDAIAGSELESLKRELEMVVATAAAEATADGGVWDSAASGADSSQCTYAFEDDPSLAGDQRLRERLAAVPRRGSASRRRG